MPLVIIKADEVRDGEPRWWCISVESARRDIDNRTVVMSDLHDKPNTDGVRGTTPCPVAIVCRPDAPTPVADRPSPPAIDPRREVFWSAAFCAALTTRMVESAASVADLALAEWDRRWGGAK